MGRNRVDLRVKVSTEFWEPRPEDCSRGTECKGGWHSLTSFQRHGGCAALKVAVRADQEVVLWAVAKCPNFESQMCLWRRMVSSVARFIWCMFLNWLLFSLACLNTCLFQIWSYILCNVGFFFFFEVLWCSKNLGHEKYVLSHLRKHPDFRLVSAAQPCSTFLKRQENTASGTEAESLHWKLPW